MKKFLLATTALVGFAASAQAGGGHIPAEATAPANTGGITVMVGGNLSFEAGYADQEGNAGVTGSTDAGQTNDLHFVNPNTEINITAAGSAENFDYGAVVELNADVDADAESDGGNADKTYLFAESDNFGRVELGSNTGAEGALEVDASNIARATGGIDGNWYHYVDTDGVSTTAGANIGTATANGTSFALAPNLILDDGDATSTDATKITYYTPRFSGVQLGLSYIPDTSDVGSAAVLSTENTGGFENAFTGGVNYEANMDGFGLTLAAVGETAEAKTNTVNDLSAYSLGAKAEASGFSVAGNWANQGDSGTATGSNADDSTYWTAGAAYENGPAGVSITHLNAVNSTAANTENETTNTVVGADYQLAPGFTPYIEASFFELDDANPARKDNDGSVVLLGAELNF